MITFPAYARHKGISHQAVYKAVKAGRLAGAIVTVNGRDGLASIEAADREWEANTDQSKPRNSVTGQPKRDAKTAEGPYAPRDPGDPSAAPDAPDRKDGGSTQNYARARAIREVYAAREVKMNYEARAGTLISAEAVRVAVFNIQREARDMLLALPDRVAPLVVGVLDAHEVHKTILDEVRRVCLALSKLKLPGKPDA